MSESESDHLRASRARLKAAIDLTRREVREELGVPGPRGRMVLPLVAAAAGLALAWGMRRAIRGGERRRELPAESSIDQL
jgi:hypothetical protein